MTTATFSVSGLASGLDSASIVDKLVQLESAPITLLQKRQQGISAQVSALGDLASRLSALEAAATDLGGGAIGLAVAGGTSTFGATADSTAVPGDYALQVTATAQAAKWRSGGFAAADAVTGGTLSIASQGTTYDVAVADGATLADVAAAIRASGAPVYASVLTTGSSSYLAVTNRDSGFPLTGTPADGLTITESSTGTLGKPLGFAQVQAAANAAFTVDGLSFARTSNLVADALPGVTLTLKSAGVAETLSVSVDADATRARLQKFADAYNAVTALLNQQLITAPGSDRGSSLAGDTAVRGLQLQLQSLLSASVPGLATVRSLADLGLKASGTDGTLSVDATALAGALARDPAAANAVFGQAGTGLSALTGALVESYVNPVDGILTGDRSSLTDEVSSLQKQQADLQARVDAYRATLQAQFAAMESVVAQLKATGNFLTAQATALASSTTSK